MSAVPALREAIAEEVGFPTPNGTLRKDDLNAILYALDGPYVEPAQVYAYESPPKREFYQRVAAECGFDYDLGNGGNARPFNQSELEQVLSAVEDARD